MKALSWKSIFGYSITFVLFSSHAQASLYWEAGFGLGAMKNAQNYFNQATATNTTSGTVITGAVYLPVTSERKFIHLDLGIQDRLSQAIIVSNLGKLAINTISVGARIEFWRLYLGAAYGAFDMVSSPGKGVSSLHAYPSVHSTLFEGGLIWRVIPELQIALSAGLESFSPPGGTTSSTEYGIHFRFPFNPSAKDSHQAVDFDGFRYPFGFMK